SESLLDAIAPTQCDMPVIMLSATTGAGDGTGTTVRGSHDCIRKPFDPHFLVWRVNHALETKAVRSRAGERTADGPAQAGQTAGLSEIGDSRSTAPAVRG